MGDCRLPCLTTEVSPSPTLLHMISIYSLDNLQKGGIKQPSRNERNNWLIIGASTMSIFNFASSPMTKRYQLSGDSWIVTNAKQPMRWLLHCAFCWLEADNYQGFEVAITNMSTNKLQNLPTSLHTLRAWTNEWRSYSSMVRGFQPNLRFFRTTKKTQSSGWWFQALNHFVQKSWSLLSPVFSRWFPRSISEKIRDTSEIRIVLW